MLCDKDGVPQLIQEFRYDYSRMQFDVVFFDGTRDSFHARRVCPHMGICQRAPTRHQKHQVMAAIERIFLERRSTQNS